MGQQIEVSSQAVGDVALFDTDRSVSGQDGAEFASAEEAQAASGFTGELAAKIFELDPSVGAVFIASNGISVKREGGWDQDGLVAASGLIADFFIFYTEDRQPPADSRQPPADS